MNASRVSNEQPQSPVPDTSTAETGQKVSSDFSADSSLFAFSTPGEQTFILHDAEADQQEAASPEKSSAGQEASDGHSAKTAPSHSKDSPLPKPTAFRLGQPRGFRELESSSYTRSILGIPYFAPAIRPTILFNPWAYLFGPFYFLFRGMWRKGLSLAAVWILCQIPSLFQEHGPLQRALIEEYAIPHLILMILSSLFTLLFCMGYRLPAGFVAVLFVAVLAGSHLFIVPLDMDNVSAFVWLNTGLLWTALGRVFLFSLLGKNLCMTLAIGGLGLGLYCWGLPSSIAVNDLPALAYPVLCGMMGTYDLYRAKRLKKTFWW